MRFERVVLSLTAAALFVMAGCFYASRQDVSGQWTVEVQRNGGSASIAQDEDGWPDSLLPGEVIDLNTASVSDLQRLPGVGLERARAIVAFRQEEGGFSSVDELLRVDGFGLRIVDSLRPYLSAKR